jgi:transcriptional regulator with XRE-family HTH domain
MKKIPKTKAAWKRLQASSLKEAFRMDKEFARQFKRLTVPAIAELMGVSEDSLYKWLSNASMPSNLIPSYEHVCGIDYITQYFAIRSHKLLIDIPIGRKAAEIDIADLQEITAEAMSLLIKFYRNGENLEQTTSALTNLMGGIAFHRENIQTQPSFEFDGDIE